MGNSVAPSGAALAMMSMMPGAIKVDKMSTKELSGMLADPKLHGPLKDKVMEELNKRFEAKSASSGNPEDIRKTELLQKLIEGTITDSENDELGNLLGVVLPRLEEKPGQANVV